MLTKEELQATVDVYREHGRNQTHAAETLGVARNTLQARLKRAAELGLLLDEQPAMPGFRITRVNDGPKGRSIEQRPEPSGEKFEMPSGHKLKGVSVYTDRDGNVTGKWTKTKEGELDPLEIAEALKKAFEDYRPSIPPTPSPAVDDDLLTLLPCNDWHLGMFAWGKEVGTNWDLKIAEEAIGAGVERVMSRTPFSREAVVLVGGDLLHADNKDNQTAKSKNTLDVDGRYQKVIDVATRLMVRVVEAALWRHKHVTVRVLPGNHDEHSAVAVAYFLKAHFRTEPRVTVDVDPSLFFYFRFGKVLIGATHGHTVKIAQMPQIMAHRRAQDWGETLFRYVHGFHLHHSAKFGTEGAGCISEVHQAPIPQDAWHFGSGFLSGPSLQAITYHRERGEEGRVSDRMVAAMATPQLAAAA
jgi:hypothetical protein